MIAAPLQQKRITVEEYLDFDECSPEKNEFVNGRIVNMAGAMPAHGLININVGAELHRRLKGTDCNVYSPDVRVRVGSGKQYVYPELSIGCGGSIFDTSRKPYTLTNPLAVVEVLSPSTQDYDLNEKAQLYREQASIREILFISPDTVYVLHYSQRSDTTWTEVTYLAMSDVIILTSLLCELPLEDIYYHVKFDRLEGV